MKLLILGNRPTLQDTAHFVLLRTPGSGGTDIGKIVALSGRNRWVALILALKG
jgi:hypothetical protein